MVGIVLVVVVVVVLVVVVAAAVAPAANSEQRAKVHEPALLRRENSTEQHICRRANPPEEAFARAGKRADAHGRDQRKHARDECSEGHGHLVRRSRVCVRGGGNENEKTSVTGVVG